MASRWQRIVFVTLICILGAQIAFAQPSAIPDEKVQQATAVQPLTAQAGSRPPEADSGDLIIGDWYEVAVNRNAEKQISGFLVKATDDWIVLGRLHCTTQTIQVPGAFNPPLVGPLFATTQELACYTKSYSWIPRQNAVIEKHSADSTGLFQKTFRDDAPELSGRDMTRCTIYEVGETKGPTVGEYVDANRDGMTFKVQVSEHVVRKPRLSAIPLIGDAFTSRVEVIRDVERQFPFEKVLYVEQQIRCEPPNEDQAPSE